jgi:hypothetical protein
MVAVKYEKDPQVGEAVQLTQDFRTSVGRMQLQYGPSLRSQARLPGDTEFFRKTGVDLSNGIEAIRHGRKIAEPTPMLKDKSPILPYRSGFPTRSASHFSVVIVAGTAYGFFSGFGVPDRGFLIG